MITIPPPERIAAGVFIAGVAIFTANALSSGPRTETSFEIDKNQSLVRVTLDSGIPNPDSLEGSMYKSHITCDPHTRQARIVGFTPDLTTNTLKRAWNMVPIPFKTPDDDLVPTGKIKIMEGPVMDCKKEAIANLTREHGFPYLTKAVENIVIGKQS